MDDYVVEDEDLQRSNSEVADKVILKGNFAELVRHYIQIQGVDQREERVAMGCDSTQHCAEKGIKLRTSCLTRGCRHGYLRSGIRGFAIRGYEYSFPTDGMGTGPSFCGHGSSYRNPSDAAGYKVAGHVTQASSSSHRIPSDTAGWPSLNIGLPMGKTGPAGIPAATRTHPCIRDYPSIRGFGIRGYKPYGCWMPRVQVLSLVTKKPASRVRV
ncbi:hypothetical protein GGX14DRAFT_392102 [Mycena pura]|uniref:Uncharacterized protein n=1 Tax=Mycena pura TaxID=153505 RepID=A0AAD6VJC2_9AGAR|nr:hypothetical protein GGX14DRAFT_392102 [Mycena pura]